MFVLKNVCQFLSNFINDFYRIIYDMCYDEMQTSDQIILIKQYEIENESHLYSEENSHS